MNVVLISTYELGHQPFGLASPAAWLAEIGTNVTSLDLSREDFREAPIREADVIAFYVPMHTATRLAVALLPRVRELNPSAHICFYGLYAPVNAEYLRGLGAQTILGGEFEEGLVHLVARVSANRNYASTNEIIEPEISLSKQKFRVPQRAGLPPLAKYAHLIMPDGGYRIVGYTEASRGCKHLCRHCPIVPVYDGTFRIVQREIVLEDIRRQVAAGAQHISFGDPDFFNGPAHALAIVQEMHREFPSLSYDATIKIEHLLNHAEHLPTLRDTGCLFVTSAVESVDDLVLDRLAKGHSRAGFLRGSGNIPQCRTDTATNVRAVFSMDNSAQLFGSAASSRRAGFSGECRADSTGDSSADSCRFALAGSCGDSRWRRSVRRCGACLSVETF